MSRIDQIKALLKERGPMTVFELAEALDLSDKAITNYIGIYRSREKGIRVVGFDVGARKRKTRYYALGDEPDEKPPAPKRPPSVVKRIKHPGLSREEVAERKRAQQALANIKPFRHWQDVALFGVAA